MFLTIIILAGNTMVPISLRTIISLMHSFADLLHLDKQGCAYVLRNPRTISYLLFDQRQTIMLGLILLGINATEYFFFLANTLNSTEGQNIGDHTTIAGKGWFQTISTRSAGLQIMDFKYVNHGMLIVWMASMYISSAPLVSRMYVSEQTEQTLQDKGPLRKAVTTRTSTLAVVGDFQRQFLFRSANPHYPAPCNHPDLTPSTFLPRAPLPRPRGALPQSPEPVSPMHPATFGVPLVKLSSQPPV